MAYRLTLPSSEISCVTFERDALLLHFSAALAQPAVKGNATWGHLGGVTLRFEAAQVQGDLHQALGALTSCELWMDGALQRDLALPGQAQGEVRACLGFRGDVSLVLTATGWRSELPASAKFHESLAC
jgi:hypothetical protein